MNKGIAVSATIFLLLAAALLTSYAMWSDSLKINNTVETGEVDFYFSPGSVIHLDQGLDWNASYYPSDGYVQLDKDVGSTNVTLLDTDGDGDYDTMNITMSNVYPWYVEHIAFKVCNGGTIPIKIWKVIIDGNSYYEVNENQAMQGVELDLNHDGVNDTTIWWGDNFGVQLHHGDCADISMTITVLQPAPQNTTLSTTISMIAVAWNEYSPSG